MLKSLHIRNFALVQEQTAEFNGGLNIITGETGAGKSVIMGAMRLLLGQRADKSIIRSGESRAELTAILEIPENLRSIIVSQLDEVGIECEDELIIRRIITKSSTRNFINAIAVPLQVLKNLGVCLIDIFSAGEQHSLADSSQQRSVLDRFLADPKLLASVKSAYGNWQDKKSALSELQNRVPNGGELDILRHQFNEISEAQLREGEEAPLFESFNQASSGRERLELSEGIRFVLAGDEKGSLDYLRQAVRQAMDLASLDEVQGKEFLKRIESLISEVTDLDMELEDYSSRVSLDPQELQRIEDRMQCLNNLKKKYGIDISEVIAYGQAIAEKIELADSFDDKIKQFEAAIEEAEKDFYLVANKLSAKRKKQAIKLAKRISDELHELEFLNAEFEIQLESSSVGKHGVDEVSFRFSPNLGEPTKALGDIASSGEISRVMLAVKSVLADIDSIPILIFDEIDANIGGITATTVARKLFKLGQSRQLFCVTHLPQVAAAGSAHYRVIKDEQDGRSVTTIKELEGQAKIDEIGRMLGGEATSSVVYDHARELMASVRS